MFRCLGLLFVLTVVGCGGAERQPDQGGTSEAATEEKAAANAKRKSLTIGLTQYPSTLHPIIENMVGKFYVLAMAMRPLTRFNAIKN